jgi:leucyl-tRNA synthetase
MEWTESGVVGAFRFVQRLFRAAEAIASDLGGAFPRPERFGDAALALRRATHRTIVAVTESLDSFGFNVAVARLHELVNAIGEAEKRDDRAAPDLLWARQEAVLILCRLMAPMMPHLAEEVHALFGPATLVAELPWPEADPALIAVHSVTIAVQVLGKLRGTIEMPPGAEPARVLAAAEAEPNVARALDGKRIVKRIHVPDRIVNFVVAG